MPIAQTYLDKNFIRMQIIKQDFINNLNKKHEGIKIQGSAYSSVLHPDKEYKAKRLEERESIL